MQFLGKIDTATQNGSEQVYIPDVGAQWRNETAIAVYDQANTDPVVLNTPAPPTSQVKAAKMAFGPAFGVASNGMVMYEAGHSHAKATGADNIAAQRAFLNFALLNGLVRGVKVSVDIPSTIVPGSTI
jgi:large repetitive protein